MVLRVSIIDGGLTSDAPSIFNHIQVRIPILPDHRPCLTSPRSQVAVPET
jgi:hypothetical protein